MTREQLDELKADSRYKAEILSAFAEGKQIEWQETDTKFPDIWMEFDPAEDNEPFDWHDYVYRIKPLPWRAEKDSDYFFIDTIATIEKTPDTYCNFNDSHYAFGNYFATQEEAETVLSEIQTLLNKHRGV